jgi:hypothetical protein
MKIVKTDRSMLGFIGYILALIILAYFRGPKGLGSFGPYAPVFLILCLTGISSYFLLERSPLFRPLFLLAYFGIILALFALNIQSWLKGNYENGLILAFIFISLAGFAVYPFLRRSRLS